MNHVSMDTDGYRERIGYTGAREPTPGLIRRLHRAHLLAVPFENLDIPLGRPIELSVPAFYDKIVPRRRGGFCYELNGLFGWLLQQLGIGVTLLSARVYHLGKPGPDFEHALLLVEAGERLIADVGFGDSFIEPLPLEGASGTPPHPLRDRAGGRRGDRAPHVARRRLTHACGGDSHPFQTGADRPCGCAPISR